MKKILILLLVLAVACTPETTQEQLWEEIAALDAKYGTDMREEMFNRLTLTKEDMYLYLEDLSELRKKINSKDERQARILHRFISAREQMLLSQLYFQDGWVGVGEKGRVSDGFLCSDIDSIKEETMILDKARSLSMNTTGILDAVMTESDFYKEKLGVGDNKPAFYDSNFNRLFIEIRSNVKAMKQFCGIDVETKYLNVSDILEEEEDEGT